MANIPNGVYGNRPWQAPPQAAYPPQAYIGPFASNQERLLSQSMAINTMTAAEIQEYVRPPMPQIKKFPERFGYETREYGLRDIIEFNGRDTVVERIPANYTQLDNTTESTSRNALGQV